MEETKVVAILSALANGVNPTTGEIFNRDSPYQHADIVRALFAALERFKGQPNVPGKGPRPKQDGLVNAGKPWSDEEDRRLLEEFDRGRRPNELARDFGRTLAGIEARLEQHGRLSPKERTTSNWYSKERAPASSA